MRPSMLRETDQVVRYLLVRREALDNRRPVDLALLAEDARAWGLPAEDVERSLHALARWGAAMRTRTGWRARPPPFPRDVTDERAARMVLYA